MSDAALPNPIPPLDASPEITELERLAKAATPGPWIFGEIGCYWSDSVNIIDTEGGAVAATTRGYENGPSLKNAAYIAAANPETILKLLALLRRLGEREARLERFVLRTQKCAGLQARARPRL